MANFRYVRTIGQTAKDQFEVQVEIEVDSDSETEPNLEVLNSFLTAITGERSSFTESLNEDWFSEIADPDADG